MGRRVAASGLPELDRIAFRVVRARETPVRVFA